MRSLRQFHFLLTACLLAVPSLLRASLIDTQLIKIQQSEFVFPVGEVNAPFFPLSWVNATYYSNSQVNLTDRTLRFEVMSESEALIAPVWVGKKDMVVVGEYASWQQIQVNEPTPSRLEVTTLVPVLAWVRQMNPATQGGLFVAPNLVNGGEYNGYSLRHSEMFAGAVVLHWNSDRFAWAGGLISYTEEGSTKFLPYAGAIWRPTREVSLSLILPWPTLTYAPTPHFMMQLGMSPAGTTVGASKDGQKLTAGFSSMNLLLSVHHQLTKNLWLSAGAGRSGFGSFTISSSGDSTMKHELDRGPVFSLQLALRPSTK